MSPTDPRSTVTDLFASTARVQLSRLLRRREALAQVAVEHTGHDLPGADLLWQAVHDTEQQLRGRFPRVWQHRNADWVIQDAERLHTSDQPKPEHCRICARTTQDGNLPAPRAS